MTYRDEGQQSVKEAAQNRLIGVFVNICGIWICYIVVWVQKSKHCAHIAPWWSGEARPRLGSPVKRREVDHAVALLKLPELDLLTLAVGPELDLDAAVAQEGRGPAGRVLLRTHLVPLHPPRLGELVHVKLEEAVAAHGVVALVAVVVAAEAAEASAQVRRGHHLHETVAVPRDLQTCGRGHLSAPASPGGGGAVVC